MWTLIIIVIAVVGAGVGTYLFLKNNPNKAKKIDDVVGVITKKTDPNCPPGEDCTRKK